MKSSTSWPWSRKYSAIVRPDRPTRRRAPGGSFIWPKTSATLSSTPDSVISRIRSLPSRVRSPTPVKTETPPCCCATLWISSWISTVLPTPAPPKRPILPPRTYGAIRSMTLMPVSKISIFAESSPNFGGSRWIGQRSPVDGFLAVDRIADHVPDAPERDVADRHRDRRAGVDDLRPARETVGRVHRDGAHAIVAEMLLHLRDQLAVVGLDAERAVDRGQLVREDGVEDDALDLDDAAGVLLLRRP